jgi:hypothetical protein
MLGAVLALGAVVYFYVPPGGPVPPGPPPNAGLTAELTNPASKPAAAAPRDAAAPQALPEPIKLKALETVSEANPGGRDPFGFGIPPRPPAPPPPPPVVVRPTPTPTPTPVGPPPRPPVPVKFLGFAEDPSRPGKLVSLSINGTVVIAREGDVVDGKYRLLKVGLESIVMSYLDGQGQTTIKQSGS